MDEATTFKVQGAQGDVLLVKVDSLPASGITAKSGDRIVLAHSETGHHHEVALDKPGKARHYTVDGADESVPLQGFLEVTALFVELRHKKEGPHAHGTVRVPEGVYEVRRAREYNPWTKSDRRVVD